MNHRVSIVVSSTSTTESLLGALEVCSKELPLKISLFKECVHCTFFFLYMAEPCAEFTFYSPLVLCHSHFLSRVNAQKWSPRKDQALHWIASFRPFLLALFLFYCLPTYHSQPSVTQLSVYRELQYAAWWKKSDSPASCVFAVVTVAVLRTHVWRRQIHEQNHTRRVSVHPP